MKENETIFDRERFFHLLASRSLIFHIRSSTISQDLKPCSIEHQRTSSKMILPAPITPSNSSYHPRKAHLCHLTFLRCYVKIVAPRHRFVNRYRSRRHERLADSHIDRRDRRQLSEDYVVGEGFGVLHGTIFQDIGSRFLNQVPPNSPFRRRGDRYSFPLSTMHKVSRRRGARRIEGKTNDVSRTRGIREDLNREMAYKTYIYVYIYWILINLISF